jgi:hypothetical protein
MALFLAVPPVPPAPPAIQQCTTSEGTPAVECAVYDYKHRLSEVRARFLGDVHIDAKSNDILTVGPNAWADVEESSGNHSRRLSISNGHTVWTIDGVEHAFDAPAREWLRDVLTGMPARPVPPPKPAKHAR